MTFSALLLLMTASAINTAIPGPAVILVFTRSSCRGPASGTGVSAGFLVASLCLATAAVLILAGLMEVTPRALAVLRWVGAGVILWTALRLVLAPASALQARRPARAADVLDGFAIGITSPFNLVFLLALLPQFAPGRLDVSSAAALVAAYVAGQAPVLAGVTLLGAAFGTAFLLGGSALALQRLGGAALGCIAVVALALPA